MQRIYLNLLVLTLLFTGGCTHSIHLQHISDFEPVKANAAERKVVVVETSQRVILGFAFDTQYVDDAKKQLIEKCPAGVSAVSTQYSTDHGFLYWTNKIRMQGICAG